MYLAWILNFFILYPKMRSVVPNSFPVYAVESQICLVVKGKRQRTSEHKSYQNDYQILYIFVCDCEAIYIFVCC